MDNQRNYSQRSMPVPLSGGPSATYAEPMRPQRSAAFFDLDKTIISRSSTLAFSRSFFDHGLLSRRTLMRSLYANVMFGLRGADADQIERLRAVLTEIVAGWPIETVRQSVAETLHSVIAPIVFAEAIELIDHHHHAGRDVVIVSASGSSLVEPIGELLGVDRVIATHLVEQDGCYTGEIDFYAFGPHKADAIRDLAIECDYDLTDSYAYSDSQTDLPMLECVGHPYAVNPDRLLRTAAIERGWPILEFARPTAIETRNGFEPRTGVAAAALLAATGVGAAAVVAARHHASTRS